VNFAAETHVDRSIIDSGVFTETNVIGTQILLDISRKYGLKKFVHLSTDEVYGEIKSGQFREDSPLKPNSPYAASKAAADLLIRSYVRTYDFPAIIVRPCNNYGPWQYPEKLIPLAVLKILRGERVPLYADGRNTREWLFVEDCAAGILEILEKSKLGSVYNLGSGQERQNIKVVKMILKILKKDEDMIEFVPDRPGHDIRYRLDSGKLFKEIKWKPKLKFADGLKLTMQWYLKNTDWFLSQWKNISPLYK
jgi:dTDP-glucose 4,6-dehydratase